MASEKVFGCITTFDTAKGIMTSSFNQFKVVFNIKEGRLYILKNSDKIEEIDLNEHSMTIFDYEKKLIAIAEADEQLENLSEIC